MDFRSQDPFGQVQMPTGQGEASPGLSDFIAKVNAAKRAQEMEALKAKQMLAMKAQEDAAAMDRTKVENASREKIAGMSRDSGHGQKGYIPAESANELLGEEIFKAGTMVSPGERILAGQKLGREKPPVAARSQLLAIRDAEGFLGQIQAKFRDLSKQGKTGPVKGRWAKGKAFITSGESEPAVESYNRLKVGLVGRLKSVAGEVGRITDDDIKRMGALIAGLESGEVAAEDAFREIQETLARGRSNIEEVYPGVLKQIRGGYQSGEPKVRPGSVATDKSDDDPMGINR